MRSCPSRSWSYAKTTATDALRARAAAAAASLPSAETTVSPAFAALAVSACSGVTTPDPATNELPPPLAYVMSPKPAGAPMTAIVLPRPRRSGSVPGAFFRSTVLSSASWSATCWAAGVETSFRYTLARGGGGWSKIPSRNIVTRTCRAIRSIVFVVTAPVATASASAGPKNLPPGISTSRPPFADGAVDHVAPQSDMTRPRKPSCPRSTVLSRAGSWHENAPLTSPYPHMTAPTPACTATWNGGR